MPHQEDLAFTFTCHINAPVHQVFTAITDQHAISTFFTDASSGPLTTGATVLWRFGDLEIDVQVEEVVLNRRIVCNWPAAGKVDYRTTFTFTFDSHGDTTVIHVSETGWSPDAPGLASVFDQCSGWTHFFASLKARLEHNVDLKHFYVGTDWPARHSRAGNGTIEEAASHPTCAS
ncbi:MAG: SRPBCC domain-containing protein [Chloroflexota bacterium]|nr:SRPBCC domain-containing protein [Chloroflexota bacterium]MDE2899130.1 SRPBCC domain-containing protein [Chloroflexota bacterium]